MHGPSPTSLWTAGGRPCNAAGAAIVVDAKGRAVVAGVTQSGDFPIGRDAFDPTLNGLADAFVTKLNASGSALVYSTYVGGAGRDEAQGLALSHGRPFVAG